MNNLDWGKSTEERNNNVSRYDLWKTAFPEKPFREYHFYIENVKRRFADAYPDKVYHEYDGRLSGVIDQKAFTAFIEEDLK